MKKDTFEVVLVAIGAAVVIALGLFITPIIYVGFGYLGGLIVEWIFGGIITNGLNLLFNTTRFEPHHIPIITATLAVIGGYFKSVQTNKKDK